MSPVRFIYIMQKIMFEIPSRKDIAEVIITPECVSDHDKYELVLKPAEAEIETNEIKA